VADQTGTRPDLGSPRRVHVIGAGGSGMSAIAIVLLAMGHQVSGSDAARTAALDRLEELGAEVHVGHDPSWVRSADVVARSTAIPDDNPEVTEAGRLGLRVWKRSELLAAICDLRRVAAVSGTHGKTTTSAMLFLILRHAGLAPSMIVGGDIAGIGPGAVWEPAGDWLVVEADESDGTFLEVGAEAVVVTSVEPDHLEHYGGLTALAGAFSQFIREATAAVIVSADDAGARAALNRAATHLDPAQIVTYGTSEDADVRVTDLVLTGASTQFVVEHGGLAVAGVSLPAPGVYNALNATAAMALAHSLGVSWTTAADALTGYPGVARRFERRGERNGVTFVDDYGHLPGEVAAVLSAARAGEWQRIVVVFQPHRYSRTEALWPDFADAFTAADILFVTDLYPAGEQPRRGVTGELVYRAVRDRHPDADVRYVPALDAVAEALNAVLQPGDLCVSLGAGDVTTLPDRMLK
jgi:UDP-N-acetylmuramate--alanine ligase